MALLNRLLPIALLAGCGTMETYFAQDVVDEHADLAYVSPATNPRQRLDLYLPRGITEYPVVVFIHGGYWIHQAKDYAQPVTRLYRNAGIALARRGIGTAVIDYRLVPDVAFPDEYGDVLAAVAWTQQHIADYGGDPTRMALVGHSAGGHMTALTAFREDLATAAGIDTTAIRAYVPLSPILDLHPNPSGGPSIDPSYTAEVFGDDLETYSPATYFSTSTKPSLYLFGEHDEPFIVDELPGQVAEIHQTIDEIPGASHSDMVLQLDTGDGDHVTPLVADFLLDHL